MNKDFDDIESLVFKFQQGEIKPEELKKLLEWYNSHADEQLTITSAEPLTGEQIKQRMLNGLMSRIKSEEVAPKAGVYQLRPWLWASSVAAILLVFAVVWINIRKGEVSIQEIGAEAQQDSILPGGNKAVLLLADGSQMTLDTEQQGIVMDDAIHYANGRQLDREVDLSEMKNLQLYIPKGGIYQVTLSDGTQVWLNSDTRLKYPSRFSDTERIVELDGEAFFVVKSMLDAEKRRVPFIVKSKSQSVEVVGTQFNVNSYSTQPFVKTTLVEGSVRVQAPDKEVGLRPGQQASTMGNRTKVQQVDPQNYIAWKAGKFSFDGKTFEETMAEVGRWYNLSIVYKGRIPAIELVGDAYRNNRINLVLRLLDAANVRYELDIPDRTLIIY